jgi:hypothetical protein
MSGGRSLSAALVGKLDEFCCIAHRPARGTFSGLLGEVLTTPNGYTSGRVELSSPSTKAIALLSGYFMALPWTPSLSWQNRAGAE